MKKTNLIFILINIYFTVFSYKFRFEHKEGDLYRLISTSSQTAYIDNRLVGKYEQGYKANLRVIEVNKDGSGKLKGEYYYLVKPYGENVAYRIIEDKIYPTEFIRYTDGKIEIDRSYFYPVVRNLPIFPENDIQIGYTWEGTGYESQDFTRIGIKEPFIAPFKVMYKYEEDKKIDGKEKAVIKVFYYINQFFTVKPIIKPQTSPYERVSYPIRAMGFFEGYFNWDKENNIMDYYEGDYNFIYIMSDGTVREWKGKDVGNVTLIRDSKEDKKKISDEASKIGVASVKETKDGVQLTFTDILFDFNKTNIKNEFTQVLDKVIEILKKYPKYEVRIEGHSDDIGDPRIKEWIAEGRAKSVANYFISKGIDKTRVSYIGFSDKKPIVPNNSDENRAKNRRVEIYIITN
jgi:outer membrane protein OmpA-like peptidoglycan-associated protein